MDHYNVYKMLGVVILSMFGVPESNRKDKSICAGVLQVAGCKRHAM